MGTRRRLEGAKMTTPKIDGRFTPGPSHPGWQGGVHVGHGYVYILRHGHPCADKDGYVMRAIIVWEETNGMPFPKGMEPHHKNLVRNDDRPENIEPLTMAKHHHAHRLSLNDVEIRRLYFEEHLSLRAVGRKLGIEHNTAKRHIHDTKD